MRFVAAVSIGFALGVVFQRQIGIGSLLTKLGLRAGGVALGVDPRGAALGVLEVPSGSIVFFGDSLVEFQEWHEIFGTLRVLNRGRSGAKLTDLVSRCDFTGARAVVCLAGINDVGAGVSEEVFGENYGKLLAAIPDGVKIYAVGMPAALRHGGRDLDRNQIIRCNDRVRTAVAREGGVYVDIFEVTRRMGDRGFDGDGLHFSPEGYRAVVEVLRPFVEAELTAKD